MVGQAPAHPTAQGELKMKRVCTFVALAMVTCGSLVAVAENVVVHWNNIASNAIVTEGKIGSAPSPIYFAYVHIAEYDAVNAIAQQFQPFYYRGEAPRDASQDAAVVAAAHRMLVHLFPAQQASLDGEYNTSLASIPDGSSKKAGVTVGEAAAAAFIAARKGDGFVADVAYTPKPGAGNWQPTPPGNLPPLTPWAGAMKPFTMTSASQFLPGPPPSLDSELWKRDLQQVRTLGSVNSTLRTPEQKEIGLFWTEHTGQQYSRAFAYLSDNNKLSVADSARLMAMLWAGFADGVIGCLNAKYHYGLWRPVTAIRAGDGAEDKEWTPLGTTPNHPEYPAAHGCVTAAVSHLIENFFGTTQVHIVVDSKVTGTTHTFEDTRDLLKEVCISRIYAGFHYNNSLEVGTKLGTAIAQQMTSKYFLARPAKPEKSSRVNDQLKTLDSASLHKLFGEH
jgi:hypothetical protein